MATSGERATVSEDHVFKKKLHPGMLASLSRRDESIKFDLAHIKHVRCIKNEPPATYSIASIRE